MPTHVDQTMPEVRCLKAAGPPGPSRRLLLLSHNFPPMETAGALRWEKLAPLAALRGYELDAVTAFPDSVDRTRLDSLPTGTSVTGVPDRDPWPTRLENWAARRRPKSSTPFPGSEASTSVGSAPPRVRPDSLGPDEIHWSLAPRAILRGWWYWQAWLKERQWAWDAAAAGARLLTAQHCAIVSCGPPHQVHVGGARLARRFGLPHIVDLRDPWARRRRLPEIVATPLLFALNKPAERATISRAALVVANTPALRDALRLDHPDAADRIIAVMNGYDDETYPSRATGERFVIAYAGNVYLDRTPRALFTAVARLATSHQLTPENFAVDFLGPGGEGARTIEREAKEAGVERYVRVLPRKPRAEALDFLTEATVLLSLPQDSAFAIPSKLFEYLGFEAWVLALAAADSPSGQALAGTGVAVIDPGDVDRLSAVLAGWLVDFRRGVRPGKIPGRERLSRAHQANLLFDAIDRVTGGQR